MDLILKTKKESDLKNEEEDDSQEKELNEKEIVTKI